MSILTRYLLRAHVGPFLFAFVALTGVILINTLARRLADLAGKGLPTAVVWEFFYLAVPATIALTFPMAVLVSVLYTFSQFTAENEITALKASGVDLKRLLLPLLAAAVLIAGFMVWFNDRVLPEANHRWSTLWGDIARKTPTLVLQEQTINHIPAADGRAYFMRASRIDPATNRLWDVVIYDVSDPNLSRTIYADSGRTMFNAARTDLVMRLYDGHLREMRMNEPQTLQQLAFREQVFGIPGVGNELRIEEGSDGFRGDREMTIGMLQARIDTIRRDREATKTAARKAAEEDLEWVLAGAAGSATESRGLDGRPVRSRVADRTRMAADRVGSSTRSVDELNRQIREYEVEIHKKISIAVATLVFVILGAPLALRFPAGGIGMVIAASLGIFSLYYIGLIGGEALADAGRTTPTFAMWVMNGIMTVVGLVLLSRMGRERSTARGGQGLAAWAAGLLESVRGRFRPARAS
jgi:lipopolysaccharide export system permease protein